MVVVGQQRCMTLLPTNNLSYKLFIKSAEENDLVVNNNVDDQYDEESVMKIMVLQSEHNKLVNENVVRK